MKNISIMKTYKYFFLKITNIFHEYTFIYLQLVQTYYFDSFKLYLTMNNKATRLLDKR